MKIYTRRGDQGKTDLWASDRRVSKSSARIEAYGAVDELIGLLGHAAHYADETVQEEVHRIQNELHVMMAHLADRDGKGDKRITDSHVDRLEDRIDTLEADLPDVQWFVLPGGSEAGSILHYARSVCRRVERRVVELDDEEGVEEQVLGYINRLSDLVFVLARYQNDADGVEEEPVEYDG